MVLGTSESRSRKGPCSAARLSARMQWKTTLGDRRRPDSGPPEKQVSGARACAAGATPPKPWSREPEPVHREPRTGKPDAGKPPVRFGWGATEQSVLYPHVRLKAHLNSRVRVPDLADTEGPVTESNCAGAISPGGEQLEVNNQSVTRSGSPDKVNSIRSAVLASLRERRRSPNKIVPPALREWNASEGEPQMVGDGMVGSSSDVNQGTTAGGERTGRGQSPRSSEEAGNDRGAKGGRDVVLGAVKVSSQKGPGSAARLNARMRRKTGLEAPRRPDSGPPVIQGERGASLRGWYDSSQALESRRPVHR